MRTLIVLALQDMVISMISKLATLALASSVIMMHVPVAQATTSTTSGVASQPSQTVKVSLFPGEKCVGPNIKYSSNLTSLNSCDTCCQELDDYLSVLIEDPIGETKCFFWVVHGCHGIHQGVFISDLNLPDSSTCHGIVNSTAQVIKSVRCLRGTCPPPPKG